jgi:hypothetical protein
VSGPARPGRPGRAWATGYARRAARPDPPEKAGTEPAQFQVWGHDRIRLPAPPPAPVQSPCHTIRSARPLAAPSPFSVNAEPSPLPLPDLHHRPARSPLSLSPVFVTGVRCTTHREFATARPHSPICNPNPLSLTSPVTHRLSTAGSLSPATSARLFCAAHPLRLSLPNPLARRHRRRLVARRRPLDPRLRLRAPAWQVRPSPAFPPQSDKP